MPFMVIAFDRPGTESLNRRKAFRQAHLQLGKEMYETGRWLYAAGILNESGDLVGSMIVCDFPSHEQLQREWLSKEPYLTGQVWDKVNIYRVQPALFMS